MRKAQSLLFEKELEVIGDVADLIILDEISELVNVLTAIGKKKSEQEARAANCSSGARYAPQ